MARPGYKTCKVCGRHSSEVGPMSHNRLCRDHSFQRAWDNNIQISAGVGPYFEHQQRRTFLAARQRLLALEQPEG